MIFLVQFGINKHLLIFSKTTNCTRPTGSCNFVSLWKNLLVLIYSKLHSKSCDYPYQNVSWIAGARTDDVGCVPYISTEHLCDVRRMLYGNIINSFWPITARAFLWTFYNVQWIAYQTLSNLFLTLMISLTNVFRVSSFTLNDSAVVTSVHSVTVHPGTAYFISDHVSLL